MAQTKTGVVVSTKMLKTAVVRVEKYHKHPLYKKQMLCARKQGILQNYGAEKQTLF